MLINPLQVLQLKMIIIVASLRLPVDLYFGCDGFAVMSGVVDQVLAV